MPRPQFTIRTLLWLTLGVGVCCAVGPPLVRNCAPKWGRPSYHLVSETELLRTWPTGRVEIGEVQEVEPGVFELKTSEERLNIFIPALK